MEISLSSVGVGIIGRTTLKPIMYFYDDFFIFVFLNSYSRPPKLPRFITIAIENKTPQEVWSGSPATYSDLKFCGCLAFAHVDNGKLEPRSMKCIFLGYKSGVKGYKIGN